MLASSACLLRESLLSAMTTLAMYFICTMSCLHISECRVLGVGVPPGVGPVPCG